jgi:hypothetical protein
MHILVDDRPCEHRATTVAEAIAEGVRIAQSQGRMVVDVYVDGEHWSEARLTSEAMNSAPVGEVRLHTAVAAELAGEVFQQAADAVQQTDLLQRDAAELIQAGKLPAAMEKLAQALSLWSQVQMAAATGSKAAGINLERVEVDGVAMNRVVTGLNDRLRQLHAALKDGDSVTLADTLMYDLPPVVTEWRSLLHELARLADDARLRRGTNP